MEIDGAMEQLNSAGALWMRSASDIADQEYKDFFTSLDFMGGDPLWRMHFRVEGMLEYTGLIYIPSSRPFDLFDPDRKPKLKLYCNQVFITDNSNELLPSWLRFLRGVVDSSDLPLNVSREMLQNNPILRKIKSAVVKRTIDLLEKKSKENASEFADFWGNFGAVLKESLYEGSEHQDRILKICRYHSTKGDDYRTLDEYKKDMKEGQEEIFCITAETIEKAKSSPQLEAFTKNDVEVLIMIDPIDDFWLQMQPQYDDIPIMSITRTSSDPANLGAKNDDEADTDKKKADDKAGDSHQALLDIFKDALGDRVTDVRVSKRLTTSAVCLAMDGPGADLKMNRVMRAHNAGMPEVKPVLEINPDHTVMALVQKSKKQKQQAIAQTLLDQA
ncbi:MAG: molecular chaperone HtpG, partial [Pseudomonadota bacterium]